MTPYRYASLVVLFALNGATMSAIASPLPTMARGSMHTNRLVYADTASPTAQHVQARVSTDSNGAGETQPPAQPFIRDLATGTLLDYFFLSPRPHTWKRDYSLLSGWEVDRRGGTFEFDPNGIFRAGFAFHINWFKLVDTNSSEAVALKHQIARQHKGKVTLEFRFMLPQPMEGASWQLMDMKQAAVKLMTVNGNLACQAGKKTIRLQRIEPGTEYGVRVVADVSAKTADIYVDGNLKVSRAAFANPAATLDYVQIATSPEGTGDMFLNPVTIYKGYHVRETFVSSHTNSMPVDWRVESGQANVQEFVCGTSPDIFSLRLNGKSGQRSTVSTAFEPLAGPLVWEYRFLLPEKQDGVVAELDGRGGSPFKVATTNGNLCAIGSSEPVLLARNYRSNLWYMVKLIGDPQRQSANVFVNGKQVATNINFPVSQPHELRFSSPARMWVDDIEVYPWRDYPADYVPEPKPVNAQSPHIVGIQSCNLWLEGRSYAGWEYVYPYASVREPYLGWYDEGNAEATDWETKWQVEHGIDFEMHCWYRPDNAINNPIKDAVCDQAIIRGLFNGRYSHMKKFGIMMVVEGANKTNLDDFQKHILPFWIEYFFKDPRYIVIDNKPLVTIYMVNFLINEVGGLDNCRELIRLIRKGCKEAGFDDAIVCGEHRGWDQKYLKTMQGVGIDYFYAYMFSAADIKVQQDKLLKQREASRATGLPMMPCISVGTDSQAWNWREGPPVRTGWVTLDNYRALSKWVRDEFMPSLPAESLGRRVVWLDGWNEWGEGHFIMPSALAGFGYVDILREVFATTNPHQDAAPTDAQKRRFNALFPREFTPGLGQEQR